MKFLAAVLPGGLFACAASMLLMLGLATETLYVEAIGVAAFPLLWLFTTIGFRRMGSLWEAWGLTIATFSLLLVFMPVSLLEARIGSPVAMTDPNSLPDDVLLRQVSVLCYLLAFVCATIASMLVIKARAARSAARGI